MKKKKSHSLLNFWTFLSFKLPAKGKKNNPAVSLLLQRDILRARRLRNRVGSGHECCSKFGERGAGVWSGLLVLIWAARTACGARDSRQTRLLTEQLVSLAKLFPSLRASCLGSKVKDDKQIRHPRPPASVTGMLRVGLNAAEIQSTALAALSARCGIDFDPQSGKKMHRLQTYTNAGWRSLMSGLRVITVIDGVADLMWNIWLHL